MSFLGSKVRMVQEMSDDNKGPIIKGSGLVEHPHERRDARLIAFRKRL